MKLLEQFEVHTELNSLLWQEYKLRPEVRDRILEIVSEFESCCEFPMHIVDIHIVGSQASFNYSKHSDLDVHIISNFELTSCSKEILQTAYNSLKSRFNSEYDISIKGIEVELYVEDVRSTVNSNGVYSVYNDAWIKLPQRIDSIPDVDITDDLYDWKSRISEILLSNNSVAIESMINDLYLLRKNGLDTDGEFSVGNLVFKELRNEGLLDKLKDCYKETRSKELSLESLKRTLHEDSRSKLLSKSKQTDKGFERFKKRVKSRVANSVKQYNAIDMNKLFKDDILTVDVNVKGETDNYIVKISFGGFCELLRDQLERQEGLLNYKAVTRALILGFNKDDVYISCNCPDWQYRFAYFATKNQITSGDAELRPSDITNPDDKLGSACKHVLLVLSNTSFLLKVASTILNYIRYMEKHYSKLYADIIYPAIYGKEYSEPVQLTIDNADTLATDTETIDKSNEYAKTKTQFKPGNTSGVRFASNNDQITLDDNIEDTSTD